MGTKAKKHSNYIVQGGILAAAGMIVRLIGLIYRIPLTNIIGDEGNGYYAAAFEVYSVMLLISSYSLPVAVSKLVSARIAKGQYRNARKAYKGALIFAVVSGGIASAALFFLADFFAGVLMTEPMSAMGLRLLAPAVFLFALTGVVRGYFQGMRTMVPTAVSQIIEQIVKAVTAILFAAMFLNYGKKVAAILRIDSYGPAYGAAGAVAGTVPALLACLIFLSFVLYSYRKGLKRQTAKDTSRFEETYAQIFQVILLTVLPVILSTAVYNISNVLDQGMYNKIMTMKGLGDIKTAYWGMYSGKYRVLTNVPIALANAMCASVIPVLTAAVAAGNMKGAKQKIANTMRFTMILAIPSAVGLGVLALPIMNMLFSGETELPARLLQMGSAAVVFYALSTLENGVLQGINKMNIPVRNASAALAVHLAALYLMLYYLNWGIYAVVGANVLFAFLMCVFNGLSIRRYLKYRQEVRKTFLIPLIASIAMGLALFLVYRLLILFLENTVSTLLSILVGVIVYFVALLMLKGVRENEIRRLPGGDALAGAAKLFRLL